MFTGTPQQHKTNKINTDLSKINDAQCVKCSNTKFTMLGVIKMISPIQSASGKWDTAVQTTWVCTLCGLPFNAQDWLKKETGDLLNEQHLKNSNN